MVQIEAPGVNKIKVKTNYKISAPGCWAIEVSGRKDRNDGLAVLRERQELENQKRLLPAEKQGPDETGELKKDTCRYGDFNEQFQIEMKFKKPKVTKVGPVNGIFYLIFEEEEDLVESDE